MPKRRNQGRKSSALVNGDGAPQLVDAVPVVLAQLGPRGGIVDQHEAPLLAVASARRADRGVEDAHLHVLGNRVGLDPSHRSSGVQRFTDVHRVS